MKPDDKEIKITKLEIQLSDAKVSLSISDAKKLYEQLEQLFASKVVTINHDYWTYHPYYQSYVGNQICCQSSQLGNGISCQQNQQVGIDSSTLQMAVTG